MASFEYLLGCHAFVFMSNIFNIWNSSVISSTFPLFTFFFFFFFWREHYLSGLYTCRPLIQKPVGRQSVTHGRLVRGKKNPPLCLLRREREGLNKETGKDLIIRCPPLRGKTPFLSEHMKTLPHLQSFMTAWDELV